MKIEIRKSKAKQPFRVLYIGNNGEILATSEGLSSRKNAIRNIKAVGKIFGLGKPGSEFYTPRAYDYTKNQEGEKVEVWI